MQEDTKSSIEKVETVDSSRATPKLSDTQISGPPIDMSSTPSDNKNSEQFGFDWFPFGTSWSSAWLKTARERTSTTFEMVKKDLSEFSDAVASEATAIASNAVESMKQQAQNLQQIVGPVFADDGDNGEEGTDSNKTDEVKNNIETEETERLSNKESSNADSARNNSSGWKLPQMSELANNPWMKTLVDTVKSIAQEETTADEDKITEVIMPKADISEKCTLPNRILYAIQTDTGTYLNPPEGDEQLYVMWLDEFDLEAHDQEINNLLRNCPSIRKIYQELVPQKVNSAVFWERYFYKVHQTILIERCKNVALDESFSIETSKEDRPNTSAKKDVSARDSPDQHTSNDETWSICSSVEMEELPEAKDDGNHTPKADGIPQEKDREAGKSSDSWINWEE